MVSYTGDRAKSINIILLCFTYDVNDKFSLCEMTHTINFEDTIRHATERKIYEGLEIHKRTFWLKIWITHRTYLHLGNITHTQHARASWEIATAELPT